MLFVLITDGMSVVVNVMLSLSVMIQPSALCNLSARHCCEVMYLGCLCFRRERDGFLNCNDICMCVGNKQFISSSSLFLIPFMLTCSMMRFLSLLLLGRCVLCGVFSSWSVCKVVVVPYVVGAIVVATVMHELLFVLHAARM